MSCFRVLGPLAVIGALCFFEVKSGVRLLAEAGRTLGRLRARVEALLQ
ncbi:MAG: hypothetical protein ACUVX9_08610 [Anaerolineae bacterium]